jgi:hypothetical protein
MYSAQNKTAIKMCNKLYCKVCADAKKPTSVVTSHNVRNLKNGAITCPTLLEQTCKNCGKRGHTVSRCKLTQAQSIEEATAKKIKPNHESVKNSKKVGFDALMSDSEDDSIVEDDTIVEEVFVPVKPLLTGYASALLKQVTIKIEPSQSQILPQLPNTLSKPPRSKFSWADCDYSSSEDEEEEE